MEQNFHIKINTWNARILFIIITLMDISLQVFRPNDHPKFIHGGVVCWRVVVYDAVQSGVVVLTAILRIGMDKRTAPRGCSLHHYDVYQGKTRPMPYLLPFP